MKDPVPCILRFSCSGRSGFSYVPWMVGVGVVSVLIAVLIPVVGDAREGARRAKCADNLRQIGTAIHWHAEDNRGKLPRHHGGNWPWDLSVETSNVLLKTGPVTADNFYCPSGPYEERGSLWTKGVAHHGLQQGGIRVTSYVLLLEGAPRVLPRFTVSALGEATVPRNGEMVKIPPHQRELAVDAVLSAGGGRSGNFHSVTTGGLPRPDRTNHLIGGTKPAGGNVLYVDGHVAWRDFEEMLDTQVTGRPIFWW